MAKSTPNDPFATTPPAVAPGDPNESLKRATPRPTAQEPPPATVTGGKPKTWMNVVAIIAPFAGFIIPGSPIAAIVFGHLGVRAADRGEADQRGLGLAGMILGYVFTALGIIAIVLYLMFVVWAVSSCFGTDPSGACIPDQD